MADGSIKPDMYGQRGQAFLAASNARMDSASLDAASTRSELQQALPNSKEADKYEIFIQDQHSKQQEAIKQMRTQLPQAR